MPVCILDTIPKSKRAFFVRKKTTYPSGFGRSCPMHYDEPLYYVMRRPVDSRGNKDSFYGKSVKYVAGPFAGDAGKAIAEKHAQSRNESYHIMYV